MPSTRSRRASAEKLRALFVLGDTDRTPLSLHALEVHSALSGRGHGVRTVALAPGKEGGLDADVPVLGPTPGGLASTLQLGREQRWADAVVCFGATATATHLRSPGRSRVLSVAVCDSTPTGRRRQRALERVDVVLFGGCEPPAVGAREIFLATEGSSSSTMTSEALCETWVDVLSGATD